MGSTAGRPEVPAASAASAGWTEAVTGRAAPVLPASAEWQNACSPLSLRHSVEYDSYLSPFVIRHPYDKGSRLKKGSPQRPSLYNSPVDKADFGLYNQHIFKAIPRDRQGSSIWLRVLYPVCLALPFR